MNLESTTKSKNLSKTQITINTHLTTLHPETFFLPPLNPPLPSKNSVSLSHPLSSIRLHIHPSYLLARFIYLSTRSLTLPHRELFPLPPSGSGNRRHQADKLALPPGNSLIEHFCCVFCLPIQQRFSMPPCERSRRIIKRRLRREISRI